MTFNAGVHGCRRAQRDRWYTAISSLEARPSKRRKSDFGFLNKLRDSKPHREQVLVCAFAVPNDQVMKTFLRRASGSADKESAVQKDHQLAFCNQGEEPLLVEFLKSIREHVLGASDTVLGDRWGDLLHLPCYPTHLSTCSNKLRNFHESFASASPLRASATLSSFPGQPQLRSNEVVRRAGSTASGANGSQTRTPATPSSYFPKRPR